MKGSTLDIGKRSKGWRKIIGKVGGLEGKWSGRCEGLDWKRIGKFRGLHGQRYGVVGTGLGRLEVGGQ